MRILSEEEKMCDNYGHVCQQLQTQAELTQEKIGEWLDSSELREKITETAWAFLEGVASTLSKGEPLDFEKLSRMLANQTISLLRGEMK